MELFPITYSLLEGLTGGKKLDLFGVLGPQGRIILQFQGGRL